MRGSIEFYHFIGEIAFYLALLFSGITVVLLVKLHIFKTILFLSGSLKRRAIRKSMTSSYIPSKMPYEPRTHDVISGNNFITEEKGQAFEDIKDDFEWGEELIAAANPNEREDNKQLETIWYFEDGDWKSKEVYLSEIEEKEVESLTSVGKTENDSNATTKLDLDVVGDGVTTKLDLSVSEIGCDVTTKLELDDLDEGVKPTTKLDVSEIDDGSGVTTKLDLSAIDAGSEVTTKLDLCEFGEE